ncbi:MAG: hypothetical protein NT076_04525 [Candidatus Pacearchaeota archaeon]|nr:hypothetical protein [Candidatus Pacearchaeota archaeon]
MFVLYLGKSGLKGEPTALLVDCEGYIQGCGNPSKKRENWEMAIQPLSLIIGYVAKPAHTG